MTRTEFDTWLNNELRNVPVPAKLRDGLRRTLAIDNACIESRLTDVDLPPQLIHQLHEEVASLAIDDGLRSVTIPGRLSKSLRRFVRRRAMAPILSTAAAVLIMTMGAIYLSGYRVPDVAKQDHPAGSTDSATQGKTAGARSVVATDGSRPISGSTDNDRATGMGGDSPGLSTASDGAAPRLAAQAPSASGGGQPPSLDSQRTHQALVDAGVVPASSSPDRAQGAPLSRVPGTSSLRIVRPLLARGGRIPLARGFDRQFLLTHGVNPRVFPSRNPQLAECRVRLSQSVAAFEGARADLEEGRWPQAEEVRVEDFLAAARYRLGPAPTGELKLFTNIGPSPFRDGHHVLQIAVKAGESASGATDVGVKGSLLTVVVDLAPDMQYRLADIRRALQHAVARMRNCDRLSVVMSTSQPTLSLSYAKREDAATWVDQMSRELAVDPQANLVMAVQVANGAVRTPAADYAPEHRRQVVISCGSRQLEDTEAAKLAEVLSDLEQDGIRCLFTDVGAVQEQGEEKASRRAIDSVVRQAGLIPLRCALTQPLYPLVDRWLPHREQPVAHDVRLKVTFDTKSVRSYRLVGYERSTLGQVSGNQPEPLRAHDVASAVYELELSDKGQGQKIADVVVKWSDATGRPGVDRNRAVRRSALAASDDKSAPALRLAILAAETAEVLGGSRFTPMNPTPIQSLVDYAEALWPRIDASGNRELRAILQDALRISPGPP